MFPALYIDVTSLIFHHCLSLLCSSALNLVNHIHWMYVLLHIWNVMFNAFDSRWQYFNIYSYAYYIVWMWWFFAHSGIYCFLVRSFSPSPSPSFSSSLAFHVFCPYTLQISIEIDFQCTSFVMKSISVVYHCIQTMSELGECHQYTYGCMLPNTPLFYMARMESIWIIDITYLSFSRSQFRLVWNQFINFPHCC